MLYVAVEQSSSTSILVVVAATTASGALLYLTILLAIAYHRRTAEMTTVLFTAQRIGKAAAGGGIVTKSVHPHRASQQPIMDDDMYDAIEMLTQATESQGEPLDGVDLHQQPKNERLRNDSTTVLLGTTSSRRPTDPLPHCMAPQPPESETNMEVDGRYKIPSHQKSNTSSDSRSFASSRTKPDDYHLPTNGYTMSIGGEVLGSPIRHEHLSAKDSANNTAYYTYDVAAQSPNTVQDDTYDPIM